MQPPGDHWNLPCSSGPVPFTWDWPKASQLGPAFLHLVLAIQIPQPHGISTQPRLRDSALSPSFVVVFTYTLCCTPQPSARSSIRPVRLTPKSSPSDESHPAVSALQSRSNTLKHLSPRPSPPGISCIFPYPRSSYTADRGFPLDRGHTNLGAIHEPDRPPSTVDARRGRLSRSPLALVHVGRRHWHRPRIVDDYSLSSDLWAAVTPRLQASLSICVPSNSVSLTHDESGSRRQASGFHWL